VATDRRRDLGALGERLAAEHLARSGYRVLDRNYRTARGELDLVAAGSGSLVFCEVKTRVAGTGGPPGPLDAIGPVKRRRLRRLAREWMADPASARRPWTPMLRFDAIAVTLSPAGRLLALDHLEGAF
jgi:putative endonuclease